MRKLYRGLNYTGNKTGIYSLMVYAIFANGNIPSSASCDQMNCLWGQRLFSAFRSAGFQGASVLVAVASSAETVPTVEHSSAKASGVSAAYMFEPNVVL